MLHVLAIYVYMFCREDELTFKYGCYISELLACARQNTQCECFTNKCESRSAKHFSVRTTEQMVCICDFPLFYFLEVVQL